MTKLPDGPPEMRGEIASSVERVQGATKLFDENFYLDGKPKTRKGKKLYKRYYVPEYGEKIKSPFRPVWRMKLLLRSMIRKIWRRLSPPICEHCDELIEDMIMGVSINYLNNTWYHYSCYKEVFKLPK